MSFDRIGLGTTTPQADFHLVGNSIVQGNVTIGLNSIAVNPLRVASDGNVPTIYATHDGTNGIYSAKFEGTTSVAQGVHIKTIANNDSINALLVEGTSSNVVVKSSGKVGLGTDTPSEVLHVVGNAKITGAVSVGSIDISTIATSNLSSASVSATNITATTASLGTVYASAISIPSFSVSNISASVVSSGTVHVGSTRLSSDKTSYTLLGTDTADEVLNTKIVMYGSDFAGVGGTIKLIATEGQGGDISFNYQPSTGAMVTNMVIGSDGRTGIGTNVVASGVRLAIQGNVVVSGATTISGATILRNTLSVGGAITGSSLSLSSNMTTTNLSSAVISSANAFVGNLTLTNGVAGTVSINTAIINTASIGTLTFNNVSVSGQLSASSIVVSSLSANTGVVITEYISTAYIRTADISNARIIGTLSVGTVNMIAGAISSGLSVLGDATISGMAFVVSGLSIASGLFVNSTSGNSYDTRRKVISLGPYNGGPSAISWEPYLSEADSRGWRVSADDAGPWGSFTIQSSTTQTGIPSSIRLLVDKGGNVGIGTTNAINKLHVNGDATVSGLISASGITVNGIISATTIIGAIQTTGSTINGTLSVSGSVNVAGALYSTDYITIGYSTASSFVRVSNSGKLAITDRPITSSLELGHSSTSSRIDNNNNNPILLNFGYTGSVGVGATNATNGKLEVLDNQKTYGTFIDKYNAGYGLGVRMASSSSSDYVLYTTANGGSTPVLFATCAGNVGIGTTTAGNKLVVNGTIASSKTLSPSLGWSSVSSTDSQLLFYGSGTNWSGMGVDSGGSWWLRTGTGTQNIMMMDAGGNVGIGTASPGKGKLMIQGGSYVGWPQDSAGNYLNFWWSADPIYSGAGQFVYLNNYGKNWSLWASQSIFAYNGYGYASDVRIKKDITEIQDNAALEKLRLIQPSEYSYVDTQKGIKRVFGFISQQVEEHFPEAVGRITDYIPNVYSPIIPNLQKQELTLPTKAENGRLKIICAGKILEAEVEVIDADNNTVKLSNDVITQGDLVNGQVFVYGYEIDDFHTLNKDFLFTINFAATQELDRKVAKLEQENAELKQKLEMIMARLNLQ